MRKMAHHSIDTAYTHITQKNVLKNFDLTRTDLKFSNSILPKLFKTYNIP
jgi:hypothetical protein